ncbi:MAG TPA: BON domain-containing protein [Burkholderiales bacterium]|jgi:osmotically-inducible protein OsmY|nr:BON domain-containing protein [Burkholderiales bacterium]
MRASLHVPLLVATAILSLQACAPLLIGAGVGAGVMMAEDRRTGATMLEDQTIEIKAANRIKERFDDQVRVNVTSFNRFVLLTGQVPSEEIKNEVALLVLEVPNVRNVQNELAIAGATSLMARSNDGLLSTRVKGRLVQNKNVSANHVKVVTESGTVYLMGLVTRAEAEEAAQTAATTGGVQRVVKVFEYLD